MLTVIVFHKENIMPHPTEIASEGPTKVGLMTPAESASKTDIELHDCKVTLPPGLQAITLTVEEAELIRKKLDDTNQPAYEGKDLPKADPSVLRRTAVEACSLTGTWMSFTLLEPTSN
jgi:hypothetical protein